MAEEVKDVIKGEIKRSKYFGMLFDTTPDMAKREEMSQVMRYVHIDYEIKIVCVKETFLEFTEVYKKDAGAIRSAILKKNWSLMASTFRAVGLSALITQQ